MDVTTAYLELHEDGAATAAADPAAPCPQDISLSSLCDQ